MRPAMMKRPTFASFLRETEAFLSALREMGFGEIARIQNVRCYEI